MNLFTQKELSEWDQTTLNNQKITDIELIDRATESFLDAFFMTVDSRFLEDTIICMCGRGNNGADGLLIATKLFHRGYQVEIWDIISEKQRSEANQHYHSHLPSEITVHSIVPEVENNLPEIGTHSVMIDAIYGIGLHGELSESIIGLIDDVNNYNNFKVAVDIPSGMYADLSEAEYAIIVEACITFQVPKLSFFLEENLKFLGDWIAVEIELDQDFYYASDQNYTYYNAVDAWLDLPLREPASHKHEYGHVLLCSGSMGKIGSAVLSSRAILKSGCGLATIHAPECAYQILQISVPEAMVSLDPSLQTISELPELDDYDVIAIGPGLGQSHKAQEFLFELMETFQGFIVLDADALNILAAHSEWMEMIDERHILLPHAGEFDRLFGASGSHSERIKKIEEFTSERKATIVLKGPCTITAQQYDGICFNSTGNPGMSTAGSGDVLTGIVASMVAQLKDPAYATKIAVFLHGLAGDLYVEDESEESLIASEIINYLGAAFQNIKELHKR